jgi:acyl carrier protein
MVAQSEFEHEVARLIVDSLNLEGKDPGTIDPEAPLFNTGLGLDSIDALEIALAISRQYGFQLRSDDGNNAAIFASLRALSAHIATNRTK